MASGPGVAAPNQPRMLRAVYLAESEGLLRETRATALYFLPGPILWLIVFLVIDYGVAGANYGWSGVPGLTPFITAHFAAQEHTLFLVVLAITLLIFLWLILRYFRWISTVYAVTTSRVIVQRGIFSRDFDEIPVQQVRGVDVHQSFGQRMLGFGTVRVSSEGGTKLGNEDWKGVPRPFEFQRLIESATDALGRSR